MKVNTNIKIKPRNIVKFATRVVSGGSASYVTDRVIKRAIGDEEISTQERVQINLGIGGIGIAVASIVGKETDELVDIAFDAMDHARKIKVDVEEPEVIDHEEFK